MFKFIKKWICADNIEDSKLESLLFGSCSKQQKKEGEGINIFDDVCECGGNHEFEVIQNNLTQDEVDDFQLSGGLGWFACAGIRLDRKCIKCDKVFRLYSDFVRYAIKDQGIKGKSNEQKYQVKQTTKAYDKSI